MYCDRKEFTHALKACKKAVTPDTDVVILYMVDNFTLYLCAISTDGVRIRSSISVDLEGNEQDTPMLMSLATLTRALDGFECERIGLSPNNNGMYTLYSDGDLDNETTKINVPHLVSVSVEQYYDNTISIGSSIEGATPNWVGDPSYQALKDCLLICDPGSHIYGCITLSGEPNTSYVTNGSSAYRGQIPYGQGLESPVLVSARMLSIVKQLNEEEIYVYIDDNKITVMDSRILVELPQSSYNCPPFTDVFGRFSDCDYYIFPLERILGGIQRVNKTLDSGSIKITVDSSTVTIEGSDGWGENRSKTSLSHSCVCDYTFSATVSPASFLKFCRGLCGAVHIAVLGSRLHLVSDSGQAVISCHIDTVTIQ